MVKIRKGKLKDIPQLVPLAIAFMKYHQKFDKYYKTVKNLDKVYEKFYKMTIYSRNYNLLVAEVDGKIIGLAVPQLMQRPPVYFERKIGGLGMIYILEEYRKGGIGKMFFNEQIKWLKSKGVKHVELSVDYRNEIGKKAWERYGFKDFQINKVLAI